ncbi:arsenate reductase (glutaredoxin) [Arhodomonas sp. AD133]|uniref:arsenate reductase (glutaredoxin) n=1 Tax=Arhodomonas sp. AD133 TaxID=3415009 RepID=UPI003EBA1EC3
MTVRIYHNPRCSKSRQTLALLREHGVEPDIVEYLKTPPSATEIERLLTLLELEPRELMRRKEQEYRDLGLAEISDRGRLIQAMTEHPRLMERPIVVNGERATLGRPPEQVLEIL